MLVVVVYDISDDKRRLKLSNFLEGQGRRVQESVFECFLSLKEMRQLHQELKRRVKPEDNVRLYWISKEAVTRVLTLGSPPPQKPPDVYII
ncbi:MAG: CRISPR-associated endonuclease Cas2 [Leptolyngbyaceae cyanobacterium SM1_3_5]|nr:CRISPR-associated endonuclease Cas2 [Leptolyngbyaceae cyanobacterium SM1_3_5]